jgi:hypothetical protein
VRIPPPLKEKILGFKFTKELAVPTTFAVILTNKVDSIRPNKDKRVGKNPPIKLSTSIGSETGYPDMTTVADVTATPTNVNVAMDSGRPIA